MTFSASEAAFEGFRIVRRNPLAILFWALAYIVFFVVFFAALAGPMTSFIATVEALEDTQPTPQQLFEAVGPAYASILGLGAPLGLILGAVLNAAVARAVLFPQQKAFGFLRLGSDELRVLAVSFILAIVIGALTIVMAVVTGVAAGVASQVNSGTGVLVGVLVGLACVVAVCWLAIRLSLAVPLTLAEKRIAPFASFPLTRGKALPILGMAIIAAIMSILVSLLGTIIALPITMMTGGFSQLGEMEGQTLTQIIQQAGGALMISAVVNAVFSALQLAVLYAPFAAAYRDLKGLPAEPAS